MMSKRPAWLRISRRTGFLFGLLLVALGVLIVFSGDLLLSYRLAGARQSLRQRDWDAALAALDRAKGRGQATAKWHYLRACALRRNGRLQDVQKELALASELGWNDQDIQRQRLLLKAQSGRIKESESELKELIQASEGDEAAEEIYEAMARGYLTSFHVADATQCLRFWIDFQPDNPLPHLWLADLYQRLENTQAAADGYQKVLEIKPNHLEARLKLAKALAEQLKLDEAADEFQKCIEQSADSGPAFLGLADCKRRQGETEAAKSLLYDALLCDLTGDEQATALSALGQMALEDRDYAPAIGMLEQSIALSPAEPPSHLALAASLSAVGQKDRADAHRDQARQLAERHNRLVSVTRQSVMQPDNADLRCEAGLILMEQGFLAAGAQWLQTAVRIDPKHRSAHRGLASYYREIGDLERARQHESLAQQASEQPDEVPPAKAGTPTVGVPPSGGAEGRPAKAGTPTAEEGENR